MKIPGTDIPAFYKHRTSSTDEFDLWMRDNINHEIMGICQENMSNKVFLYIETDEDSYRTMQIPDEVTHDMDVLVSWIAVAARIL